MGRRPTTVTAAAAATTALLAGTLVAAPAASASTGRSTVIVSRWCGSFLGRGLDRTLPDPGRSYRADRLDAGEAPAQALDDLVHTHE